MTRFVFLAKFSGLPTPHQLGLYDLVAEQDVEKQPLDRVCAGTSRIEKLFMYDGGSTWIIWIRASSQLAAEDWAKEYFAGAEVTFGSRES